VSGVLPATGSPTAGGLDDVIGAGRPSRPITSAEFAWIREFLHARTGIALKDGKQALVVSRLDKRLREHGLGSFSEYFALIDSGRDPDETRTAIDLLTTNETYFFRESAHFTLLSELAARPRYEARPFRVWSAASSTGEEAYSIALTLASNMRDSRWEVVGTDISSRVVKSAQRAVYPLQAADNIPDQLLREYCLKGRGEMSGQFTFDKHIRQRVRFLHANLMEPLTELGQFDVIFLRNVMIYFDTDTKRDLVERLSQMLHPGGYLLVSHSESINGLSDSLKAVSPSVFTRKEG